MQEKKIGWGKIYWGLLFSLFVMIALLYWLTVSFS